MHFARLGLTSLIVGLWSAAPTVAQFGTLQVRPDRRFPQGTVCPLPMNSNPGPGEFTFTATSSTAILQFDAVLAPGDSAATTLQALRRVVIVKRSEFDACTACKTVDSGCYFDDGNFNIPLFDPAFAAPGTVVLDERFTGSTDSLWCTGRSSIRSDGLELWPWYQNQANGDPTYPPASDVGKTALAWRTVTGLTPGTVYLLYVNWWASSFDTNEHKANLGISICPTSQPVSCETTTCGAGSCASAGATGTTYYCPSGVRDTCMDSSPMWTSMTADGAPSSRKNATAVWSGTRMLIWGGEGQGGSPLSDGAAYDPQTDSWTALPSQNAPLARTEHVGAWDGQRMLVWGGWGDFGSLADGARYSPASNSWSSINPSGAPTPRYNATGVWDPVHAKMLVWGGIELTSSGANIWNNGAAYSPQTNSWTALPGAGAPTPRYLHSAVWSGTEMLVWGGRDGQYVDTNTGARFNPQTSQWQAMTTSGAPQRRDSALAFWTGSRLLVWGGFDTNWGQLNSGGLYDPATDQWQSIPWSGAPFYSSRNTGVWDGRELMIWGGCCTSDEGGTYKPGDSGWGPLPSINRPQARDYASAVWSGKEMLIWGGFDTGGYPLTDGARLCVCANPLTYYRDLDGDGRGNPQTRTSGCDGTIPAGYVANRTDCDDTDPSSVTAPGLVAGLSAQKVTGATRWTWNMPAGSGSGARVDIVKGNLVTLRATGTYSPLCLASGSATGPYDDTMTPAPGGAEYRLIQARNLCGAGGYADPTAPRPDPAFVTACP